MRAQPQRGGGVLGTATAQKNGGLRYSWYCHSAKNGGLRCGHNQKEGGGGVLVAAYKPDIGICIRKGSYRK